jgi:hypothetical protein
LISTDELDITAGDAELVAVGVGEGEPVEVAGVPLPEADGAGLDHRRLP